MPEKFDADAENVSPRDAQKGGQGALSAHHPERPLKQDAPQPDEPPVPVRETTQDLTGDQIALLFGIEAHDSSKITEDKKHDLARLMSEGYVSSDANPRGVQYQLTSKGLDFLGKRGAAINDG